MSAQIFKNHTAAIRCQAVASKMRDQTTLKVVLKTGEQIDGIEGPTGDKNGRSRSATAKEQAGSIES
jgi:hypothetical protein